MFALFLELSFVMNWVKECVCTFAFKASTQVQTLCRDQPLLQSKQIWQSALTLKKKSTLFLVYFIICTETLYLHSWDTLKLKANRSKSWTLYVSNLQKLLYSDILPSLLWVCFSRFNDEVKHIKVTEKDNWIHITEAKKFESLLVRREAKRTVETKRV